MTIPPDLCIPSGKQPTRVRWLVFALACAVSWLLYLHRYAWGVIKPALKRDYPALTDVELGWLDSAFNATYALGQVPGGLAGDIFGPRAALTLMILAWSAAVAGLGAVASIPALGAVRALFGLAQAGAYPNLSQVTRSWFPPSVRTTVQGAVASLSGRAGGACASLVVATLLMGALHLSWQTALIAIGAAGGLFALAFWLLFRDGPRCHPWVNAAEVEQVEAGNASPAGGAKPRLRPGALTDPSLLALLLYALASTFADQLYVFWIPTFLVEGRGLSPEAMGVFAMLPLLGGAVGGTIGGMLNDVLIRATGSRRLGRAGVAFTGKGLAAILVVLSVLPADGRLAAVVLLGCKFFADWSMPTQWGTITDIAGRASGTVFGAVNMVGAIAAFAASPIMGYLVQSHGWPALFVCVAGAYVVASLCWLVINPERRLVVEEAPPGP